MASEDQDNPQRPGEPMKEAAAASNSPRTVSIFAGHKPRPRIPAPGHGFCAVCKHRRRKLVEEMYLDWYTPDQIALRLKVDPLELEDHCRAFGIDKDRAADTSRYYRAVIREAGPAFLKKASTISEKFMMAVLQQLDRVEGREQKARRNEADIKREEGYIQDTLRRLQTELNLTKEEAVKVLAAEMPEIEDWVF